MKLLIPLIVPLASAFMVPSIPYSRANQVMQMKAPSSSSFSSKQWDRQSAISQVLGLSVLSSFFLSSAPFLATAKGTPLPSFEENISYVILSKKVLGPVRRYIKIGQYDPARSNIKYVTNQFRLKKAMERACNQAYEKAALDPSVVDDAAEVSAVIDNTLSQLDSSVYTQIFIPTDSGELAPEAVKYQKQAFDFYDEVLDAINKVLALASPDEMKEAEKLSAQVDLPPFLFKQFPGGFYRPATP